ncbi:MAG TPA: hypothetical protein P5181_08650 [Dermatophilaceae bacterium]|nr:hypothetical protein [Dermatophilaceae bacterium]
MPLAGRTEHPDPVTGSRRSQVVEGDLPEEDEAVTQCDEVDEIEPRGQVQEGLDGGGDPHAALERGRRRGGIPMDDDPGDRSGAR